MNKNHIIMAILAVSFLGTQSITAADQHQPGILKRKYRGFKEAVSCAIKKGPRKCTRAQKKRIIIAGVALAAVIAATAGYIGIRKLTSLTTEETNKFFKQLMDPNSSNETLEQLLQRGYVSPNPTNISLLQYAIWAGRYKIANQLVERGAQMEGITTEKELEAGIQAEEKSEGVYQKVYTIRQPEVRPIK